MKRPMMVGILATACVIAPALGHEVTLRHAHGLGYSADGQRIMIPNHHGIAVYSRQRWSMSAAPANDYMGFSVTRKYIFSSGHAAPGGGRGGALLGLIRSRDGGETWTTLAFDGEAEFHLLAAGYDSNALYLYNPVPNSRLGRTGIYRMAHEGRDWRNCHARGMRGELFRLAVHPTHADTLAAATSEGLFLSRNSGDDFESIIEGPQLRAAYFPLDGDALWFGTFDGKPGLFRLPLSGGAHDQISLPPIGHDAVASIAQNPSRRAEFAILTFEHAVFVTPDGGKTWSRIARARGTFPDGTMPGKGGVKNAGPP
jgi:photosystem II stability/assembly factor-like uncharacterized protein